MDLELKLNVELGRDSREFLRHLTRSAVNEILFEVRRTGRGIVSNLTDKLDGAEKAMNEAETRITTHVSELKQQIADLEAELGQNPTPEDLARIDVLRDRLAALDPSDPTTMGAARANKGAVDGSVGHMGADGLKVPGAKPAAEDEGKG
jgi:polyhydroxyalkanoate synthesis regulator phasin